jgi:hypothetical protein
MDRWCEEIADDLALLEEHVDRPADALATSRSPLGGPGGALNPGLSPYRTPPAGGELRIRQVVCVNDADR